MTNDYIFSWAENQEGKIVHVDDVQRGLKCGCRCPHCKEPLLARQGEEREHGFAHHSPTRKATLGICYMVILYKLAEQIIQTKKCIYAPSYYRIFKATKLEFVDVKVDSRYEREDKQPDVIATTKDGKQYLIEFVFDYKVQHKKAIDYQELNCLEIDLSNQKLETLEEFLLNSDEERRWLNNKDYFDNIINIYQNAGKQVKKVDINECEKCNLYYDCCAIKYKDNNQNIIIYNSGKKYRLCKSELFEEKLRLQKIYEEQLQRKIEEEQQLQRKIEEEQSQKKIIEEQEQKSSEYPNIQQDLSTHENRTAEIYHPGASCFDCKSNLHWKNYGEFANCGCFLSVGVPKNTPPDTAKTCRRFRKKE